MNAVELAIRDYALKLARNVAHTHLGVGENCLSKLNYHSNVCEQRTESVASAIITAEKHGATRARDACEAIALETETDAGLVIAERIKAWTP